MSGPSLGSTHAVLLDLQYVRESRNIPRYMRSVRRKGGIEADVGESQTVPRYFSCSQSRTVPMYIAFWQLPVHSHLYLEKSRVIWDSVLIQGI